MERPLLLPLPQGLRITDVGQEEASLLIAVHSEQTAAYCPLCDESSFRDVLLIIT